jgi:hypothetical protein
MTVLDNMMQQPRPGGLGAIAPQPPNPQMMAGSSTQQAQANELFNSLTMPSIQEATRAMRRLSERIPGLEEAMLSSTEDAMDLLSPRESSWGDVLGGMSAAASKVGYAPGSLSPDMGQLLAAMGGGAGAARHQWEEDERARAIARQRMGRETLADAEKRQSELLNRGTALAKGLMDKGGVPFRYLQDSETKQWLVMDNKLGLPVRTLGGKDLTVFTKLYQDTLKTLREKYPEAPEEALSRQAMEHTAGAFDTLSTNVQGRKGAAEMRTAPSSDDVHGLQTTPTSVEGSVFTDETGNPLPESLRADISMQDLTPDKRAVLLGQIKAYRAYPNTDTRARLDKTIQEIVLGTGPASAKTGEPNYITKPGMTDAEKAAAKEKAIRAEQLTTEAQIKAEGERGQAVGKAVGTAEASLPGLQEALDSDIKKIDELLAHPGFEDTVGATWKPGARFLPWSDAAGFMTRFEQLKGKGFLQAYEMLKGAGQITEIEGTKATAALNRMSISTNEREFKEAAEDFKNNLKAGVEKIKARSKLKPMAAPGVAKFNPTTGNWEVQHGSPL